MWTSCGGGPTCGAQSSQVFPVWEPQARAPRVALGAARPGPSRSAAPSGRKALNERVSKWW